jgi:hypothetical protein
MRITTIDTSIRRIKTIYAKSSYGRTLIYKNEF